MILCVGYEVQWTRESNCVINSLGKDIVGGFVANVGELRRALGPQMLNA